MGFENPETVYQYRDEAGELLYEVIRRPGKNFLVRRPNGSGGYIWNLDGVSRVIYRLEEVALVDQVFIVEGEKDVETLRSIGLVATTNPGGANGWRPEFARFFKNKHVIILPDQDKPGYGWAVRLIEDLLGTAATVKRIDLPGLEFGSGADISDWIESGNTRKELLALVEQAPQCRPKSPLPGMIDSIRRDKSPNFEKKRSIAKAALQNFSQVGDFYRGCDGRLFYFSGDEHRLYRLESDEFRRLLAERSRLNPTETEFKFTQEEILTHTSRKATEVEVRQIGCVDRERRRICISNLNGQYFLIEESGIRQVRNGTDGVLFESFPIASAFRYLQPSKRTASLAEFLGEINFEDRGRLSPEAYQTLLRIWLYSVFVPEFHKTRVIPLFVGPQGSGKTTCARRLGVLLLGKQFDVGHLESGDRGEQAFMAATCGAPFVAFDNADADVRWLPDSLARYSTGNHFFLRELYTTNQNATFHPIASIALTSRDPQFRRPDVAERLLLFPLRRLAKFASEPALLERINASRNSLLSEILDDLQRLLPTLLDVSDTPSLFRMADFATFGVRIMASQGRGQEFEGWLRGLQASQATYATENEPLIEILSSWTNQSENLGRPVETGILFSELQGVATAKHLLLPKTASALGKKLRELETALEEALGVQISHSRVGNTTRWTFDIAGTPGKLSDFNSLHSPASPDRPEEVAEMSEMSAFEENSYAIQLPDGRTQCLICELVYQTREGWHVHYFRTHQNQKGTSK